MSINHLLTLGLGPILGLVLCFTAPPTPRPAPAPSDAARLYQAKCASCHGANGEGSKKYKQRLEGDHSIAQLTEVIHKTMPEDSPGSLSAKESESLARHIHDAFYSTLARERNRPARIDLARLTVRQYRHAVADLVGSFRFQPAWTEQRGLKAEYYKGRRFRQQDRVEQRTDAMVAFDFGTKSPIEGKIEPHEFSIRWNGSLLVPATGEYELIIRTEHAGRLWLNDMKKPLVDAWVKSGKGTEFTATVFLVGGRVYSLRLEYSKAKQGVDDSKKQKQEPPPVPSFVALWWKQPHRAAEPIASRHLLPIPAPEQFVCETPFTPDDRSFGWERGTTISREWDQATTDAALATANHVVAKLEELSGVGDNAPDRAKKLLDFCHRFAERAFRRPLAKEQKDIVDRQFAAGKDAEMGVKRAVLWVMKSPRFLFREVDGSGDAHDTAARLAFGLWDSLPDRALNEAAASGKLKTKDDIAKQAERMVTDVRGRAKLREFLLSWVKADQPHDLTRDPKKFPGFDAAAIADLSASLELFLDEVVWSEASDYRQLLLSEDVFLNGRLAKFYGADLPADADFAKVKLDSGKRAGVLTHPYLMASFAHSSESSPIHRGVFLARGVLGIALKTPPEAVAPAAPELHPNLTTRERVALQTRPASCMTCHAVINPLGFTLEHFDAVGRYREKENGKDVDSTGFYQTRDGKRVKVNDARELAMFLADSPEAHAAFVEQMFHHLVQQPVRAYGATTGDELRRAFAANKYHVRKLAVEILTTAALKPRPTR